MWSGNLVSGPGFAFIINGGHSLIGEDIIYVVANNLIRELPGNAYQHRSMM